MEDAVLRTVLAKSFSSSITLLRHTLIAMGHGAAVDRNDLMQQVRKHLNVDVHPLESVLALRHSADPSGSAGSTYGKYMETLEKVCDQLDQWLPKKDWQRVGSN
jgi:hypothetical protein